VTTNQQDATTTDQSWRIEQRRVQQYCADPDAPFMVSFPRTGSHWLRMLCELYFEQPTLVRAFYYPESEDFLTCHTHDMDLACERRRVLYLYRDPVDTVFSQINYEEQSTEDETAVREWAGRYAEHLAKWLVHERFTEHKRVVRYEDLKQDLPGTFAQIAEFFGQTLNADKLEKAAARVTKKEVKRKTAHDDRAVRLKDDYEARRARFREQFSGLIDQIMIGTCAELEPWLARGAEAAAVVRRRREVAVKPIKLTAVVCSHNEAHHLPGCLQGLAFCDELIVVDLASTDDTAEVARAHGARVVPHPRVSVVEKVRRFAVEQAGHDWVVFMDPDMVFPAHRGGELRQFIGDHQEVGLIYANTRNYFLRRPIRHGRWGGVHDYATVYHRRRVELSGEVHQGVRLVDGYAAERFSTGNGEADLIAHYWVDSVGQFVKKHARYARQEGLPRYERGERFRWPAAIRSVAEEVKKALIWRGGWRDGWMGFGLAIGWAWYHAACLNALRKVQNDPPAARRTQTPASWQPDEIAKKAA
jgi:hypothetical protein